MKILFYGLNFSPELTGVGKYSGEMIMWLAERGHECRVITTPPYYPAWKIFEGYHSWKYKTESSKNVTIYRCPLWVPSHPKAISRIFHLLSFNLSSIPLLCRQVFWGAEIVICIAPSFFISPQGVVFSKLVGAKSWVHFQDFEICAMFGSGMFHGAKGISKIAHKIQGIITRRFDVVSSISQSMCLSAEQHNVSKEKVVLFPNWVDIDFLTPDIEDSYYREKWNISKEKKVVLYSGNLGKKQGLGSLIDSAQALEYRDDIIFIIVGDGVCKSQLIYQCREKRLNNIQIHPLQPYNLLPSLLRMADIHLVIQKPGVADSVLPSKLTSILSVGGYSIITAEPDTELGHIVLENPKIGTLVPPEEAEILTHTIEELCGNVQIGAGMVNRQARKFAVQRLGKKNVLEKFEQELLQLFE